MIFGLASLEKSGLASINKIDMSKELEIDKDGNVSEVPVGHWKRGDDQYWHIREDSALLINLPVEGQHYDGNVSLIYFKWPDTTIRYHFNRKSISKKEFDKVRRAAIRRLAEFN